MTAAIHLAWVPLTIFLITYGLIAVESNVGLYLDRTATAYCGAVAMVLAGSIGPQAALGAIDWGTIGFLLGMMILVAHFQVSGFFHWVAVAVARVARTRFQLLALVVFTAGILSAFFVNDTICLIFAPIVFAITDRLDAPPVPYLMALATWANIGAAESVTAHPHDAGHGLGLVSPPEKDDAAADDRGGRHCQRAGSACNRAAGDASRGGHGGVPGPAALARRDSRAAETEGWRRRSIRGISTRRIRFPVTS